MRWRESYSGHPYGWWTIGHEFVWEEDMEAFDRESRGTGL